MYKGNCVNLFRFVSIQILLIFVQHIASILLTDNNGNMKNYTISTYEVNLISTDLGLSCSLMFNGSCCSDNSFQCNDGSCVPLSKLCDSYNQVNKNITDSNSNITLQSDCLDGSDEFGCSHVPCSQRKHDCSLHCFNLPGDKSFCSCSMLNSSLHSTSCSSIDQCSDELHTCSHDCINGKGSYYCSCKEGFKNDHPGHKGSCKAEDRRLIILFNSDSHLYSYDLDKNSTERLFSSGNVDSIDYDPETKLVYWWNIQQRSLGWAHVFEAIDNTTVQPADKMGLFHQSGSVIRKSISIDWLAGNLYWICYLKHRDVFASKIAITKMDGSAEEIVFMTDGAKITSLVVDPLDSSIYWTTVGQNPGITVSCVLGITVKTFVRLDEQYPEALTLDHGHGRLYWFDAKSHSIFARYKKGRKTIKLAHISTNLRPSSMDAFENHLYWVSKSSGCLIRFEKFGREKPEIILNSLHKPSAVKVYHTLKYGFPSSKLLDKSVRLKCKHCSDVCVNYNLKFKCYQDLQKKGFMKAHDCSHCTCSLFANESMEKHLNHSHKVRNILIVIIVTLSILLIFVACFAFSMYNRRHGSNISKFIQLEEVKF